MGDSGIWELERLERKERCACDSVIWSLGLMVYVHPEGIEMEKRGKGEENSSHDRWINPKVKRTPQSNQCDSHQRHSHPYCLYFLPSSDHHYFPQQTQI